MARSWLSGSDCIYLHNKLAWDGKRASLSSLTHLGLQNTFWFGHQKVFWTRCLSRGVLLLGRGRHGVLSKVEEPWEGGQGCGCLQHPNPHLVHSLRKGGGTWLRQSWVCLGWFQSRSHQGCYSHLHQEKSDMLKCRSHKTRQWLKQLFFQNFRSQLGYDVWVSYPSPALFAVQSTSSNKTTAKYGLLGSSHLSPFKVSSTQCPWFSVRLPACHTST